MGSHGHVEWAHGPAFCVSPCPSSTLLNSCLLQKQALNEGSLSLWVGSVRKENRDTEKSHGQRSMEHGGDLLQEDTWSRES